MDDSNDKRLCALKLECIILKFIQQITSEDQRLEIHLPNRHLSLSDVENDSDDDHDELCHDENDCFDSSDNLSHYSSLEQPHTKRFKPTVNGAIAPKELDNNLANPTVEPKLLLPGENEEEQKLDSNSSTNANFKTLSFHRANQAQKFTAMVRIIRLSYELQKLNKFATKRDVYYTNTTLFSNKQQVVNEAVDDLAALLETNRHSLHIVASARGLVFGRLTFQEWNGSRWNLVDCSQFVATGGKIINPIVDRLAEFRLLESRVISHAQFLLRNNQQYPRYSSLPPRNISSTATTTASAPFPFLLIVEKDAVFERLIQDGFCEQYPCVMLTSKGYPDVATRSLYVRLIRSLPQISCCLILTDADPHGIDIARVYKYGSRSMDFMNKSLCLQEETELNLLSKVHWIGIDLLNDFDTFSLSAKCQIPLTHLDERKIDSLLQEFQSSAPGGQQQVDNPLTPRQHDYGQWTRQLEHMRTIKKKAEIQALSSRGLTFLARVYLPTKLDQILGGARHSNSK